MTDLGRDSDDARREAMADRATRLFRYLAEAQRLKSRPARRTDSYPTVLWFADFPHHPAVAAAHRGSDPEPEAPLLSIDRVPRAAPPPTIEPLASWLDGPVDDPRRPPELRDSITVVDDAAPAAGESDGIDDPPTSRRLDLNEHPDVRHSYDAWLVDWRAWANQEHRDRPVRDLYGQLFKAYANATGNPEEFELVAGVGCLSWAPPDHDPVRRHLLTTPVMIKLDDRTGRLTVDRVESPDPVKIELDMLDPGLTGSPHLVDVKATAQEFDAHPLHRDEAGAVVRRLVHILDSDGEYRDVDRAPEPAAGAVAAYAPAIVLRRRSQQGMVEIYRTIVQQITDAGDVPDGLLTLIDPDHVPSVTAERADGALVTVDEEPFLPLPVNDVQLRIIRQVDTKAQTLVQGPPGTGKTHTAAALLAHLLAQGQRVLVTAHTDRALKEVREKLPAKIKPLSVSVLGTSRDDMSDLTVAVGRIAAAAAERDPSRTKATIRSCYQTIDRLRRQRAQIYRQLIDLRADEVREHHRGGLRGTLAAIATRHHAEAAEHGWLVEYASVTADAQPPVESAEMVEWLSYLRDTALLADEPEASQSLVDLTTVPEPRLLAAMATAERAAAETHQRYAAARAHAASAAISTVEPAARRDLRTRLTTLADTTDRCSGARSHGWQVRWRTSRPAAQGSGRGARSGFRF
ncbi:MAG TPA: AAA domain-containing protein [Micromonosporaceae bacterium]|nr:AAA domain-containing protein [Micromonosporaceae bacterium]